MQAEPQSISDEPTAVGAETPWVTRVLLGSVIVVWAIQLLAGFPSADPFLLLDLGANFPGLSWEQPDRLITANFLHGHWIHIALNAIGLYFLGTAVEFILGRGRLWVIYWISCVAGAIMSALADLGAPSVGASTGIVGLFGALGFVLFRFRSDLPAHLRRATKQWVFLLGLNLLLWVLFRDLPIDHAGHAGGFVAGIGATFLLTLGWKPLERSQSRERKLLVVSIVLAAVTVAGLGWTAVRAATGSDTDLRVLSLILANQPPDADRDNHYAWFVAIDPEAERRTLVVAERLARRAAQGAEGPAQRGTILDTLATVQFRLGDLLGAVETQREAVGTFDVKELRAQLARFMARADSEDLPQGVALDLRPGSFVVEGAHQPMRLFFVLEKDGVLLGMVEVKTNGSEAEQDLHALPAWTQVADARLVRGELLPNEQEDVAGVGLRFWNVTPEVRDRPGPVGSP